MDTEQPGDVLNIAEFIHKPVDVVKDVTWKICMCHKQSLGDPVGVWSMKLKGNIKDESISLFFTGFQLFKKAGESYVVGGLLSIAIHNSFGTFEVDPKDKTILVDSEYIHNFVAAWEALYNKTAENPLKHEYNFAYATKTIYINSETQKQSLIATEYTKDNLVVTLDVFQEISKEDYELGVKLLHEVIKESNEDICETEPVQVDDKTITKRILH